MVGKKPDPIELRLLKNDKAHAHRYVGKELPIPSSNRPVPPDDLCEREKEIFEDFVNRVEKMYTCSETDLPLILLYVSNQAQLESYENILRVKGSTFTKLAFNKDGEEIEVGEYKRPEYSMLKDCKDFAKSVLTEFGLSPSSRSRINLPKKETVKENRFGTLSKTKEA